jgi:hypothetical protein
MNARKQLPHRRPNCTVDTMWNGISITVTVGFDPATGEPKEIFADCEKGGQIADTIRDGCIWASLILQSGQTPDDLAKSLGRVPDYTGAENPASPLGAIAQVVQEVAQ